MMPKLPDSNLLSLIPASPLFTTTEVANAANVVENLASYALGGLAEHGTIMRVRNGVWANTQHPDFSPYAVVPVLFRSTKKSRKVKDHGYVSLTSALYLRGMIQQTPRSIHIITTSRRRAFDTVLWRYEFHRISPVFFDGYEPFGTPGAFDVATPAKALFDTLYISCSRGYRFTRLPAIKFTRDFRVKEMLGWIEKISDIQLRDAVKERWEQLRKS